MAIDANSTIHDQLIGSPTRGDSGIGNNLIQAQKAHIQAIHSRQSQGGVLTSMVSVGAYCRPEGTLLAKAKGPGPIRKGLINR
ncbi:hypothetical protein FGO68_gene13650 [Halteria grandinella]|uniref:Uncharacterized protein n=1 Tax=Halteria grandinella TaxID=5974 RepID=A0A8J8N9A7_HALGN|nr:hypothetical protein FGO68_gene13650 [Halteria grandinella]